MKAVLWPYRFTDMRVSWAKQYNWMVRGLIANGIEVVKHPDLICNGLPKLRTYNPAVDNPADFCVYNHATASELGRNALKAKVNLFFKPTVPTETVSTLDILGYGPSSQIAYHKPDFESITRAQVKTFYQNKVSQWVGTKTTKWGQVFSENIQPLPSVPYHLVIGQCPHDSVVTQMAFGDYVFTLSQMVVELLRASVHPVVVKLHPYMADKELHGNREMAKGVASTLQGICPSRVFVYHGHSSIHDFVPGARAVVLANSGAGFEVMMHNKPIISWGWPEYHWVTWQIHLLNEMGRALVLDWFDAESQAKYLTWYHEKYCFDSLAGAKRRVKDLLAALPDGLLSKPKLTPERKKKSCRQKKKKH